MGEGGLAFARLIGERLLCSFTHLSRPSSFACAPIQAQSRIGKSSRSALVQIGLGYNRSLEAHLRGSAIPRAAVNFKPISMSLGTITHVPSHFAPPVRCVPAPS